MESSEVIIIEDSPPSSPINPTAIISSKNMYYQHLNNQFPFAEQTMVWSQNKTNFIKQSINVAHQNNRMILPNNIQPRPMYMGVHPQRFVSRQSYQFPGVRPFQRAPFINYNPHVTYPYYQRNFVNNPMYNFYNNNNIWMKVKLEDIPEKNEIVSQYYFDHESQTPIRVNNFKINTYNDNLQNKQNNNEILMPEFIDVNMLANKDKIQNQPNQQTIERSFTEVDKRKNNLQLVPLFLNKNQPIDNNNEKVTENTTLNNKSNEIVKEIKDDVIYIEEYNTSNLTNITKESKENVEIKNKIKKRKRKERILLPIRRNPKRQVQLEKDVLKMIDCAILQSEKEEKSKKLYNKANKTKTTNKVSCKRPVCASIEKDAAIFSPASPLSGVHMRDWPVEGMHERPEYNPETGKIEPFDQFIRNIAKNYQSKQLTQKTNEQKPNTIKVAQLNEFPMKKSLPELCHEMLHHVLSYLASVKFYERESMKNDETKNKLQFLNNLKLMENNQSAICDFLKETAENLTPDNQSINPPFELIDLLKNSALLYCLTNNVSMSDVTKYISNINPLEIVDLSNEQFKFT